MKEKKTNGVERRYISKELCELLDKVKANVQEYGWNVLRITDVEASKILAKKAIQANII